MKVGVVLCEDMNRTPFCQFSGPAPGTTALGNHTLMLLLNTTVWVGVFMCALEVPKALGEKKGLDVNC